MTVPISEEWDDPTGTYLHYDSEDVTRRDELVGRAHIDLRSFYANEVFIPLTLSDLNALNMEALDARIMSELEGDNTFEGTEVWTRGTIRPNVNLNNRNTLVIDVGANEEVRAASDLTNIDLRGFDPLGKVNLALPNFPGARINVGASYLEFRQGTQSVQLPFPRGSNVEGNQGFVWPLSALNGLLQPDQIVLHIAGLSPCIVTVAALRVVSSTWSPTKLDINTQLQRLSPTVAFNGTTPISDFPHIWRSTNPPSFKDPRPINAKLGTVFYTGSMQQNNHIKLFFRGHREDYITQLDLNGSDDGTAFAAPTFGDNQFSLKARQRQPDYGQAVYNPQAQEDLDKLRQADLEGKPLTQVELERLRDTVSESYIYIDLQFGLVNRVVIGTTETRNEDLCVFTFDLDDNAKYFFVTEVVDTSVRAQLFKLEVDGSYDFDQPVFDSMAIDNDFLYKRRAGRLGWQIALTDGDAWVEGIRSRGLMFAEIITANFESLTPVEGARLSVGATPNIELTTGLVAAGDVTLDIDVHNSRSDDGSLKVTANGNEGVQTEFISFEDFEHTEITFDLYYPSNALAQGQVPLALFTNERSYTIELLMPRLLGDQWQPIKLPLTRAMKEQTGLYKFMILQSIGTATWWIDNMSIQQRSVAWSGRATYDDPWNRFNNRWTPFYDLVNATSDGVMFPERGRSLQIRGQALTQNATIDKVYITPKYAELGRLTWDTDRKYRS
jgi:hypothetical protein